MKFETCPSTSLRRSLTHGPSASISLYPLCDLSEVRATAALYDDDDGNDDQIHYPLNIRIFHVLSQQIRLFHMFELKLPTFNVSLEFAAGEHDVHYSRSVPLCDIIEARYASATPLKYQGPWGRSARTTTTTIISPLLSVMF